MKFNYYTGNPANRHLDEPARLPVSRRQEIDDPAKYSPDPGLLDAVNVALQLGQPLLVTGEAGTGKTQLAYSIAWELGFDEPLKFETKSTSIAKDLFYLYDTLGRFHDAQTETKTDDNLKYITYNALGIAILRANDKRKVGKWLPKDFAYTGKKGSVVLIDEIDKAPRDFPNDLLNEVEGMYFKIPELGNVKIEADSSMRPILVITSNSEKHLPDPFLRRCIYYNIPFPDRDRLKQIVTVRMGHFVAQSSKLLSEAFEFFYKLRESSTGLHKRPATAELLNWLLALSKMEIDENTSLRLQPELIHRSLNALIKTAEDQENSKAILNEWVESYKA